MVTRLGDRVRAAGTAEIAGYDRSVNIRKANTVLDTFRALFPQAGDYAQASYWAGLRPMTPDGPPYIGEDPVAQSPAQCGSGLKWLDTSLRLRSDRRRSRQRTSARNRSERLNLGRTVNDEITPDPVLGPYSDSALTQGYKRATVHPSFRSN